MNTATKSQEVHSDTADPILKEVFSSLVLKTDERQLKEQSEKLVQNDLFARHSKDLMAYEGTSVYLDDSNSEYEAFQKDADFSGDRESFTLGMSVLNPIFQNSNTVEEMIQNVRDTIAHLKKIIAKNKIACEKALLPTQQQMGALLKCFSNAAPTKKPLDNLEIIEMDLNNPKHLEEVFERYRALSLNWNSEDLSPSFIGVLKKLSIDEATIFAKFAKEINAFIFSDFPEKKNVQGVVDHVQKRVKYGGDQLEWAYIGMCATRLLVREAYEDVEGSKDVYCPASPAKIGMLLGNKNLAQCKAGAMDGIILEGKGVKFLSDRGATRILNKLGLIPASMTDGKVAFLGKSTLYSGDQKDFRDYAKVIVRNLIERAMIRYANKLSFKNLDDDTLDSIETSMANFLNVCDSLGLIHDWDDDKSGFGKGNNGVPHLKATVKFQENTEFFDIILESSDDKTEADTTE